VSHIAQVGRKNVRVRVGIAALYLVLTLGAITTVYPFLLMVSTAMKSHVDFNEYTPQAIVPRYLYNESALFQKYVEDRYANNLDDMNGAHYADYPKPQQITPPTNADDTNTQALAKDWETFQQSLPLTFRKTGFGEHDNAPSQLVLRYREYARQKFNGDIQALNTAWTEENVDFDGVTPPFERTALRDWTPDLTNAKVADWQKFKATLPPHFLIAATVDPLYQRWLKEDLYDGDLAKLNSAWGTSFKAWNEITLPRTADNHTTAAAKDWETFIRTKLPLRYIRLTTATVPNLSATLPDQAETRKAWADAVAKTVPVAAITVESPENLWRENLRKAGTTNVEAIRPPLPVGGGLYSGAWTSDFQYTVVLRPRDSVRDHRQSNVCVCPVALPAAVYISSPAFPPRNDGLSRRGRDDTELSAAQRARNAEHVLGTRVAGNGERIFYIPAQRLFRFAAKRALRGGNH
jgi:hypothetical protein